MFDFRMRYRAMGDVDGILRGADPLILREELITTFQITPTLYTNVKQFMVYNTLNYT